MADVPAATPVVPIGYANPRHLPDRPGILTAVAIVDFAVVLLADLVNVAAFIACFFLYRMTLPPPAPVPVLPLAPRIALTPYHGDYLPADGMRRDDRRLVLSMFDHAAGMNIDRREMTDRLLTECGKKMFPGGATSATFSSDEMSSSTRSNLHFHFASGHMEIGNRVASFTPADGSPAIVVTGNFVSRNGKTEFTAIAIDQTVDQVQRDLKGSMNALQAAALVELNRPDSTGLFSQEPLATPPAHEISKVEGCGTIQFQSFANNGGGWILPTGAVVFNPFSSPISLDPATGMRRVFQTQPATRQRKPLTLEHWLIVASAGEYLCSSVLTILLLIAGIRLLGNGGDAPRLHGAYALLKIALAIVNFVLGLLANQQLVDGGFISEVQWLTLGLGVILQTGYPVLLIILFNLDPVRDFYRQRGTEASMIPISWLKQAARFSPDLWGRAMSVIALLLGLVILSADYFLWTHTATAQVARSYSFYPAVFSGVVLLISGIVGCFRRRSVVLSAVIICLLLLPARLRADDEAPTAQQLVDQACAADTGQKGKIFLQLRTVNDAFLPLLKIAADPAPSYNRTLANHSLREWCAHHPLPDTPEAQAAIKDALAAVLPKIHAVPYGNDSDDVALVSKITSTSTIIPLVEPWLHERRGRVANTAMELIADAKPDDDQKWNALVAGVDDPQTRQLAAQLLRSYQASDYYDRLGLMARNDPNVPSRLVALDCFRQSFRGNWLSPAAESAVTACVKDPDASVRSSAITMLCQMVRGGEARTALLLKSPELDERQAAADALAMDPYDVRTVPVVVPLMKDDDPAVRAAAVASLMRSQFQQPDKIPVNELLNALDDPDPQVRYQAATVIRYCPPAAAALGPNTYPLQVAALTEGGNNHRERRKLTDQPPKWIAPPADTSEATYNDVDPLTGRAIVPAAPTPGTAAAAQVLPTLAWYCSAAGWPVLICVAIGIIARSRLPGGI